MILLFCIFFLIIVFVNRHDYFNNDILFYLNIFEISLASILWKYGEEMLAYFFNEEYYIE